ncbi:hypothetical protein GLW36_14770 [Halorubrum terrestre]|uniref:Restriction endonuclease type IV Mrr domain-containing protein n=1 Tax=Halorubrum distributum TaxID=29283 RepID=A0A6B1IH16_9EURY|nr:restriction endonuclease [Halorubrum terrestre]MYL17903.1 hypothetical protein [Halorubrum terrestre]
MGESGNIIRDALLNIDPYDFENLIAKIWEKNGWQTTVTPSSQDRGIDVIAEQNSPVNLTVAIQAKAYNQDNKIGSREVRQYRTLYEQEDDVSAVAIATTGKVTKQAESLANDLDIRLLDLDDITRLVASIDIMTFSSIVSPIDPDRYDLVDIPYPSTKDGCPECNTSGTLWEAELANDRIIMVCENCDATWKAKANGGWIQVK